MDNTEILIETDGISGYADAVTDIMQQELLSLGCKIKYDKYGSIIGIKKGTENKPNIMLSGHLDEIGFLVEQITEDGFLKVIPIGGWYPQNLLGQRVTIHTKNNPIIGTFTGKIEDKDKVVKLEDMFIDIGAHKGLDVKKELGVRVGDPVVPKATFEIMGDPKMYMSKAWDYRLGIALAIKAIEAIKDEKHPNTVYAVGTVQEEVKGAKTPVQVVKPDIAFALDIASGSDVTWGENKNLTHMGSGAMIIYYDNSLLSNRKLADFCANVAEEEKIPYTLSVAGGGRDTGMIQYYDEGVPCLPIGCPTRYGHTHSTIVNRDDIEAVIALLKAVIKRLDKQTVKSFTKSYHSI